PAELPALFLARDLIKEEIETRLSKTVGREFSFESGLSFYTNNAVWLVGIRSPWRHIGQVEHQLLAILNDLAAGRVGPARINRIGLLTQHGWVMFTESRATWLEWLSNHPAVFSETPPEPISEAVLTTPDAEVRDMLRRLLAPANRLVLMHQPEWMWVPGVVL